MKRASIGGLRWNLLGALASLAAVAVVSGAIELLKEHVPVLSLGVLYIFAVLPIAIVWGRLYAIAVSVLSMLAFNVLFLPPLYTITLADSRNWFALAVFVVTALVVAELAARSRRQARESALLARIASSLLEHGSVSDELERIGAEAADALQVETARIELGPEPEPEPDSYPLAVANRRVGTIHLERPRQGSARTRRRLLPALASLLGVAIDRERLAREAYEAEALRRSDAMKTALLRAVSHDLRSPLMAILTSAGALAHGELSLDRDDRRELVDTIVAEAGRLDQLVDNFARPLALAGRRRRAGARYLGGRGSRPAVARRDRGRGTAGRGLVPGRGSPPVRVDLHQAERALANLIENALRYSPAHEPVRVQVRATGSEVLVRVVDRGPGVSSAEADRIFEPFQRGSRTTDVRGAGLGLAIARGFVEANGGRIWVESKEGQGATFVLALPTSPAPAPVEVTA
jgi:two-component system sensor histidine kinase KdpD